MRRHEEFRDRISRSSLNTDFHSCFLFVVSESFRMGHAQSGETNIAGRKNIFCSVRIKGDMKSVSRSIGLINLYAFQYFSVRLRLLSYVR